MATYAIGDIHGCFETFQRLLSRVQFDPSVDQLWLTGDLVNGGPQSVETLRWIVDHDDQVLTVLGNHDLHLLAVAAGARSVRPTDTLTDLLEAPDADHLLGWLGRQPLARRRDKYLMVHAGLVATWSVGRILELSAQVQRALRGEARDELLERMYGNQPRRWRDDLTGFDRLRVIINVMTRLRALDPSGAMTFDFSGPLEDLPANRIAWFDESPSAWADHTVIFGHWSALGVHKVGRIAALDSACVWGGKLTAFRLDDQAIFQVTSEMPKRV